MRAPVTSRRMPPRVKISSCAGPVLQQDAGHAFRETQDDDDDERNVHRHQADGHDAERDGENAEDAPHAGEHLADLVLRDGHVILAHQCGEGIADDRHREPQEVPLRLPGQIPKQVDDQGDGGEQRTPKQEVLGAVAKDALAALVEGFRDDLKALLSAHFVVLFHCININDLTGFRSPPSAAQSVRTPMQI